MKDTIENSTHYYSLLQSVEGIVWEAELDDLHFSFVSNYTKEMLGYSPEEWLAKPHFWKDHIHPDERNQVIDDYILRSKEAERFTCEFRMLKADGLSIWIKDTVSVIKEKGKKTLLRGLMVDITKDKHLTELEHLEKNILELYSKNEKSFTEVLYCYLEGVEMLFPQMKCSILKVKNGRLYNWVSPSLPKPYLDAIENLPIGENTGSCGTSAFLKEIVIVNDIANDQKWAPYKDLTLVHQLRACWSQPIINSEGMVMATLGMYYEEVKTPTKNELNVIERVSTLLKIILENRLKSEIIIENSLLITQSQELAGFGNWRWDIQNDIVTWSKTLFKIYGLNEDNFEATFEGYLDLLHPEDRQRITDIISTALVTKSDVEFEERIIRPDGEIRYLTSWSRLKTDSNGLPIEMNGTCLDVTESKKTQEMLKATASRLEALSDAQTSYVVRVGLDGNYTYCNKKYLEDYDWFLHDKDITKTQASTTVQPYHRHLMDAVMQKCAENPNCLFQLEFDKIQKDGGRKPTLGHFIGLTNAEDGKVTEIQYIGLDITNLKNTERALRASNERYEYFNKASNDAMFDWDIITGYINWGNGFFRLFGFTMSDNHTFDKWATLVHPEDLSRIENSLANTIKDPTQGNWLGEYRLKKADGTYTEVEANGYIIRDDNGNGVRMIGVVKDISERLNYIKAIEEKNKKLLDIAWIQSHDVRAPLANIMALVEILKNLKAKNSDQEITLAHLYTSAMALDKKVKTITKTIEHVNPN